MSQSGPPQHHGSPDDFYPLHHHPSSPSPLHHPHHPHATTTTTGAATSTPTPTPSPPPPPSLASATTTPVSMPPVASSTPAAAAAEAVSQESPLSSSSPQWLAQHHKVIREAVRNGDSSGLRRLLEAREGKVNLNVFDAEGQTALHESCQLGNLELVKLLVRFGADVRLANRDGWSCVHIAAFGGHTDILLYLMTATSMACRRS